MNEHPTTVESIVQEARPTPSSTSDAAAVGVAGRVPGLPTADDELDALLDRIAGYPELEAFQQDIRDARKAADEAGSDHPL